MLTDTRPERSQVSLHASERPRRVWEHRDWTADAACLGIDPEIFFPTPTQTSRAAKAACLHCPVIDHCLLDALGAPWLHGVWAYTTPGERAALRQSLLAKNIRGDALREFAAGFREYVHGLRSGDQREAP